MSSSHSGHNLFVLAAPSGAGKTSLVHALIEQSPTLALSVSHTTRPPRSGERNGEHYHFVTRAEFDRLLEQEAFLEYAEVFGHRYGTSRQGVEDLLAQGRDVILEIDWQGARQIAARMPQAISIFILPPSTAALASRLRQRGQDSEEVMAARLAKAKDEMSHCHEFHYLVVNDDFSVALTDLQTIVRACRLRQDIQATRQRALLQDLLAPS